MLNWSSNRASARRSSGRPLTLVVVAASVAVILSAVGELKAGAAEPVKVPVTAVDGKVTAVREQLSISEQYCAGILDGAADTRFAMQRAELVKLQHSIDDRLDQIEKKRAELEAWLKRREAFLAMVQGNLSVIYGKMKPASAAEQLAKIDEMTAAAILLKLDPRAASSILTEMDPAQAAQLARLFVAAGRDKPGKGS